MSNWFMMLGVLFICLKVAGVIAWSWFWVLFPFILVAVFSSFILTFVAVMLGIAGRKG